MQKGFAQIFVILILLAGLAAGLYLVGRQTFFKPKASLTGTRIEFVGPNIKADKATSKDITLKIYYEPKIIPTVPPTPSPTPSLAPTPIPTPQPTLTPEFTEQWGISWKELAVGQYEISFEYPNAEVNGKPTKLPPPTPITIENQKTTEVKAYVTEGKAIITDPKTSASTKQGYGWLRVETIDSIAATIKVTPKVLGVAYAVEPRYPSYFRVANCPSQDAESEICQPKLNKDFEIHKADRVWSGGFKELSWQLEIGKQYVVVQFSFDEGQNWEETISNEITLEEPGEDLSIYFPNYSMIKNNYFLVQEDPYSVLWFDKVSENTFKMYNSGPFDECHYDVFTWDDQALRYSQTRHECEGEEMDTIYEPGIVYLPRYWNGQEPYIQEGTSKAIQKKNGQVICSGTIHWKISILGKEKIAEEELIHVKQEDKTIWDSVNVCTDESKQTLYQEEWWFSKDILIEGGEKTSGLRKSKGGDLKSIEKNKKPDWDIIFNSWKKLPTNRTTYTKPTKTSSVGLLKVKTNPAVAATIIVKSVPSGIEQFRDNWGVNWRKLAPGEYEISFSYPYSQIHGLSTKIPPNIVVEVKSNQTTGVVADLTKGFTRPATDQD